MSGIYKYVEYIHSNMLWGLVLKIRCISKLSFIIFDDSKPYLIKIEPAQRK